MDTTNQVQTEEYLFSTVSNSFVRGGTSMEREDTIGVLTVLGNTKANPYTIANFRAAFSELFPQSSYTLPVTHRYIQFNPVNIEEVKLLFSSEFNMYDYPLDKEVITMGDYYLPSGASFTDMPVLFAVIPIGKTIPAVSHSILSELHLNSPNEAIIRRALTRVGYDPDVEGYTIYTGGNEGGTTQTTDHCECTEYIQGNSGQSFIIDSEGEECNYFDEHYGPSYSIECNPYTFPPPPPNGLTTNGCGCVVYSDQRKPGGCINVRDTRFGWRGVRRVKVILKDNLFSEDEVWTDDNGCFKVNRRYKGTAKMWVKFTSPRITVRGARAGVRAAWEWAVPIKDYVGVINGPVFNNISDNFDMWNNQGTSAHLYWGAATVNNALHEFHDFAANDGILPPQNNLDVFVGRSTRYGYATMNKIHPMGNTLAAAMASSFHFIQPVNILIGFIGWAAAVAYIPDVKIGINYSTSDGLKNLAYHEYAHASHVHKVGPSFWENLILAEVVADGHGDQNSIGAPLISICESWAEFIGMTYTHRTFGNNNSILFNWEIRLERTWNESTNHIPIGLFHDLIDLGEPTFDPDPEDSIEEEVSACNQDNSGCTIIQDNVSGFTIASMFASLTPSTNSLEEFQNVMISNHLQSTSNTQLQVNTLFESY